MSATSPRLLVVSAAGSGQGKTLWVEALAREAALRGLRAGMVKHHGHASHSEGDPGKDTTRARRAGTVAEALVGSGQVSVFLTERTPDAWLRQAVALLCAAEPMDLVLAEGFRSVPVPFRVWVGEGEPPPGDGAVVRVSGGEASLPATVAAVLDRALAPG